MNISGVRSLNANNYSRISIGKHINVTGNNSTDGIVVSDKFSKSLKGKSDLEKRDEVVEYFIRNHDIDSLQELTNEFVILSSSGVKLIINRTHDTISSKTLKDLVDKYRLDRMDAYNNNEVDYYYLAAFYTLYEMKYIIDPDEYEYRLSSIPSMFSDLSCMKIVFYTSTDKSIVSGGDMIFFRKMLEDFENIEFLGYEDFRWREKYIYKVMKDGKEKYLIISSLLVQFIDEIEEKIIEQDNNKKLQLKMEGF